ncbi:hypothetical protein [Gordonia sihwensis]|uniref:hypothetical protein n=1 Tax=Gordonia sihwensis TaxID=173559 RepID=UPI0005ED983B|nr:hypothetical protein [Gordonia sihwensis]KJR10276.1 hypothetical protein UG54_01475 [Gordonia sihwensis]
MILILYGGPLDGRELDEPDLPRRPLILPALIARTDGQAPDYGEATYEWHGRRTPDGRPLLEYQQDSHSQ